MSQTIHAERTLRAFEPKPFDVMRAQGAMLTTSQGRTIMDLGGASHGTALIGHNHPHVVAAIQATAERITHVGINVPSPDRERFLTALHQALPTALARSFLCNSGTEAVECAIKLAIGQGRSEIVALDGGFHGRTMGALATTSRAAFRTPFAGRLASTRFVAPEDIDALRQAVGPDTAAVILEPIQGEAGVIPLSTAFLQAARQICDEAGALLISDEVQTGFRTGTALAITDAGITPDIATLGKGLAGGLPIGICAVTDQVAARMAPGSHGTTYGGGPLVCAAGEATMEVLGGLDRVAPFALWSDAITALQHPAIVSLRGAGGMIAIALRTRSAPVLAAWENSGYTALPAGPRGIRLLPPLTMTRSEIEDAVIALGRALPGA